MENQKQNASGSTGSRHGGSGSQNQNAMDTELGRMVVEQKLATPEEVEHGRQKQSQLEQHQNRQSLAEILVEQGSVTERQISRLKKSIEESRRQQIPGYEILAKIGSGAMATVFKARQVSLDRIVAIKVLPKRFSENPQYVERFYKEGKAAAKLNHPNIVQAIDVGEASGYHHFVMEYVEGHSLYDEISKGKVFSESEALNVAIQVARALEHAHSQGLIHRDVKPKNIMITKDGTVKLADMGLARAVSDAQAAKAEAGKAFGTPYYISPEQIRGEVNIDFRADIYSLGATLYNMLTGKVPFEGDTPAAVMHKHLTEQLTPPDHIRPDLSSGVGEVVEVMMAKAPRRRYGSTHDLLMDLEAIASGNPPLQARKQIDANVLQSLESEGETSVTQAEEGAEQPQRHKLMIYVIILAAALAASVLINILMFAL